MDIKKIRDSLGIFYRSIKRNMTYYQFEFKLLEYITDAYKSGVEKGHKEYVDLLDATEAEGYKNGYRDGADVGALWTDDQIFELLRSERIGEERARRIVDKLCEGVENE